MNKHTKITTLMSDHVIVANLNNTFSQVCRLFTEHSLHHLPVVDEQGNPIGIISPRDVLNAYRHQMPEGVLATDTESIDRHISISHLMTPNPTTLEEEDTVADAAAMFATHAYQAVPVVNSAGGVVGIFTTRDLVKFFAQYD